MFLYYGILKVLLILIYRYNWKYRWWENNKMTLVLEPDPETFSSISLTQKTLKASPAFRFLKKNIVLSLIL